MALNLYKIREAAGGGGDFFRSVVQQKPQYQGLWLVAPDGKVLMGHQDTESTADWYREWPRKVLADLHSGLAAFGSVTARDVPAANSFYQSSLPHRGIGEQDDGSITLAVYDKFVIVQDLNHDPPADALGSTVFDSIQFSADQWSQLAPAATTIGYKWSIPEAIARKFYPLLSTGDTTFRDQNEVTAVQLSGAVERIDEGIAVLRFQGKIAGVHHGTGNEGKAGNQCSAEAKLLDGVAIYDVTARKMRTLTLVFDGLWRNYAPYDDPPARFGAVVEWRQAANNEANE